MNDSSTSMLSNKAGFMFGGKIASGFGNPGGNDMHTEVSEISSG